MASSDPENVAVAPTEKAHTATLQVTSDHEGSGTVDLRNEVYDVSAIDPILAKKMAIVNDAIDEIGMTPFQWKLFFFNGFGYAVDSVRSQKQYFN